MMCSTEGCGRAPAVGHSTCCRTCGKSGGRSHGPICNDRCSGKLALVKRSKSSIVRRADLMKKQVQPKHVANSLKRAGLKDRTKVNIFARVASMASKHAERKSTDVRRSKWCIEGESWLQFPINLEPLDSRLSFSVRADVYRYRDAEAGSLMVDFAAKLVGGGCFGHGFVQEEQMVAQSTDFALCLAEHRERLSGHEAATYEGVYVDCWWTRKQAAKKTHLSVDEIKLELSQPLVLVAVDAWNFRGQKSASYNEASLTMLARKLFLCYQIKDELKCGVMYSGLLGGGAFHGNRPLVLLMHLLLHNDPHQVIFHNPIFGGDSNRLESEVVRRAVEMLSYLRSKNVATLGEALSEILTWKLPLSRKDADLQGRTIKSK